MTSCPYCGAVVPLLDDPTFDDDRMSVVVGDERRRVPLCHWRVLTALRGAWVEHPSHILLTNDILDDLLRARETATASLVWTYICYLRKKLKGSPYRIVNIHGAGYRLEKIDGVR